MNKVYRLLMGLTTAFAPSYATYEILVAHFNEPKPFGSIITIGVYLWVATFIYRFIDD